MSSPEQAAYAQNFQRQQNNPYSQTYNPGWRNHPNFSYGNTQNIQNPPNQGRPQEREGGLEETVAKLQKEWMVLTRKLRQVKRERGPILKKQLIKKKKALHQSIPPPATSLQFHFLKGCKNKLDQQFKKFLEVFKKLQINIPFADALAQMPSYAKFMKEILKQKEVGGARNSHLPRNAVLSCKQATSKIKDPGSFNIPCTIGSLFFDKALCDLGASVNLMSYSIFKQLGLGEAKPTTVTLQLADRSIKCPRGIVEDILVKVGKFIFPADFIILDMCEDRDVPLILGRPFLTTGRAVIDVQKGELMLKVNDEHITFNVFKEIIFPSSSDSYFEVDAIDQEKSNTVTLENQSDQKEHIPINKPRVEEHLSDEKNKTFIVEFEQGGKTHLINMIKEKSNLEGEKNGCNDNRSKQIKSSKDLFKVS
ncbi:Uncharacterized protein Adt_17671 [Abeliophyllum distichum]|uniref:Aspartic peptidase DDI1-type domain-containing protein n=1 Tax=Abeliophyllum distichum TaxID=126358 RepID=A0ABD1TH54_9LAMI